MSLSNYSSNLNRETPGAGPADAKKTLDDQISYVRGLEDGWQGPDSLAPSDAAKAFYESYCDGLQSSYWAEATPTATVTGGIHMEWVRHDTTYSAEILANGHLLLNVVGQHVVDKAELEIDDPAVGQLRRFVMRGLPID